MGGGQRARSRRRRRGTTISRASRPPRRSAVRSTRRSNASAARVCYASCDVVGWKPDYLGPAALNRAWTLVNDVRDGAGIARVRAVAGDAGCQACHTHQSCTERCPKHLTPTASIAGLKRLVALAAVKGQLVNDAGTVRRPMRRERRGPRDAPIRAAAWRFVLQRASRRGARRLRRRASGDDHLRRAQRARVGGDRGPHACESRVAGVLRALRRRRRDPCAARLAHDRRRMAWPARPRHGCGARRSSRSSCSAAGCTPYVADRVTRVMQSFLCHSLRVCFPPT